MSLSAYAFCHGERAETCPYRKPKSIWPSPTNRVIFSAMIDLGRLVWCFVAGLFRSRAALQAEILVLRRSIRVQEPMSTVGGRRFASNPNRRNSITRDGPP